MRKIKGLSLIEILTVITFLSILVAVAYPAYNTYSIEARRGEAHSHLFLLQAEVEQAYTRESRYPTSLTSAQNNPSNSNYTYAISTPGDRQSYSLTATIKSNGLQKNDSDCQTLTITNTNLKSASNGSVDTTSICWQ